MKNILIFARKNYGNKNNPNVLAASFQERGIRVDVLYYEQISIHINGRETTIFVDQQELNLKKYNLVLMIGWYGNKDKSLYREIALSIAIICQNNNILVWNSEVLQQRPTTKLAAMVILATNGIDVPETVYSVNPTNLKDYASKFLDGRMVVKSVAASRGRNNYLVIDNNEVSQIIEKTGSLLPNPFIVQTAISNSGDYRILCTNYIPQFGIYRQRQSTAKTHLNNTSTGAIAKKLNYEEIPRSVKDISIRASKCLNRQMGGVDVIIDEVTSKVYVLEVNPIPQITSGAFVEDKLRELSVGIANFIKNME